MHCLVSQSFYKNNMSFTFKLREDFLLRETWAISVKTHDQFEEDPWARELWMSLYFATVMLLCSAWYLWTKQGFIIILKIKVWSTFQRISSWLYNSIFIKYVSQSWDIPVKVKIISPVKSCEIFILHWNIFQVMLNWNFCSIS